ncbi:DUF262 domain-containing protein [Fibrobacter sp.]|uniref:DUF262 domain-containing protein n=1 Tax=Fibrobacter sp. TaxID=35828 RepID=UPI00386801D6
MFQADDKKIRIHDINVMFKQGLLVVDNSFQRNSVWVEKDKVRLIETILLDLYVPVLFFWKLPADPTTGESIIKIVDGQQRINAISEFSNGKFKLSERFLLNNETKELYKDKYFNDLTPIEKSKFWDYNLYVIELHSGVERENIIDIFNRLNLTNYNLNDQEKRHSKSGLFANLAVELSEEPFWEKVRIFSDADERRMKNIEFCANIITLYKKGIIDQVNQKALNEIYDDLKDDYPDMDADKAAIIAAIENIDRLLTSEEMFLFARRKTQMYTLFSFVFLLLENGQIIDDDCAERLNDFAKMYSRFKNDTELVGSLNPKEKHIFELINSYKLASSEGARKRVNRNIRLEVLLKFTDIHDPETIEAMHSLKMKLNGDLSNTEEEDKDEDKEI